MSKIKRFEDDFICTDCGDTFVVVTRILSSGNVDRWYKDGDTFYGQCQDCGSLKIFINHNLTT